MGKSFVHVDDTERRLIKKMSQQGITWVKIQAITGRSSETLNKILNKGTVKAKAKGAPVKFTPRDAEKLFALAEKMIKKADAQKEVTLAMIIQKSGYDVSETTVRKHFKRMNVSFYKLKQKPLLEDQDVKDRYDWTTTRKRRSRAAWLTKPKAIIDNKNFEATRCRKSRAFVARRSCRGAYMRRGAQPKRHLVKPKGGLNRVKFPSVQVTAAVINGRIRMWKYVDGRWNGSNAVAMYEELGKVLKKNFPDHKGRFVVLEDNDPTGYKSRKGLAQKATSKLVTDDLPKRSPDLNVLDYCLWNEISKRMRLQERSFRKGYKESLSDFKKRLRKTALSLPAPLVKKAVGDMRRRCKIISENGGELFTE